MDFSWRLRFLKARLRNWYWLKARSRLSLGLQCYVRFEVYDRKKGKVYDSGYTPSKSFVRQFLDVMEIQTYQASKSIKHHDGNMRLLTVHSNNYHYANAPVNDDDYGIMIGTGSTGETNADYGIETKIVDGAGAGQMEYEAGAITSVTVDAYVEFETRRTFTNNSGSSITVQEAVIYCLWGTKPNYIYCIARDLTGGIAVADGQTLSIKYLWRTQV